MFFGTKNRRVTTHSADVVAWKKGKRDLASRRCPIRTTLRWDQSVGAKPSPAPSPRSGRRSSRGCGRPSAPAGRCGRRGRGCATSGRRSPRGPWRIGNRGERTRTSPCRDRLTVRLIRLTPTRWTWRRACRPSRFGAARAAALGSNRGRSANGPAASTPLRIAPVRLRLVFGDPPRGARPRRPRPRPGPASGPRSMTQSAVLITSRLCSMIDDRVAQVGQAMDDVEELADVVEVQAGGRLVEDVEGLAGVGPGQLGGELDALGLAAGERRRGLAERDVAEADVVQGLQDSCGSSGRWRTARAPRRPSCRARRRSSCRGT